MSDLSDHVKISHDGMEDIRELQEMTDYSEEEIVARALKIYWILEKSEVSERIRNELVNELLPNETRKYCDKHTASHPASHQGRCP